MGYYANSAESAFLILAENKQTAFAKIAEICDRVNPERDNLQDALACFGFCAGENDHGDIDDLFYEHDKFYCDDVEALFDAIAPFVQKGSYITFVGEDQNYWAYYFDGERMLEYLGELMFPGMPMDGPKKRTDTKEVQP